MRTTYHQVAGQSAERLAALAGHRRAISGDALGPPRSLTGSIRDDSLSGRPGEASCPANR
jgi:hypothetical protein